MPDRRCAAAARCVGSEREPGTTRLLGARLTTAAGMCRRCLYRVANTISGLPADVEALTADIAVTYAPGAARENVARTRGLLVPVRLAIDVLRAEIDHELLYWAEVLGMATPVAVRQPHRVAVCAEWISPRVEELVELGPQIRSSWSPLGEVERDAKDDGRIFVERDGVWACLRLEQLRGFTRVALGRTKLVHRIVQPCARCDQRALVRENGADHIECEACGWRVHERHFGWFAQVTIAEAKRRAAEQEQDRAS